MDKLTKYNQKLLAIIGTLILVVLSIVILVALVTTAISWFGSSSTNDRGVKVITTDDKNVKLEEFKRAQEVTFNAPLQLDTAQSKFLIPVDQINLKHREKIVFESGSGASYASNNYRYQSHYGLFNNFVYLDFSKGIKQKIFDKKVAITHWAFLKIDTVEVLLFKGTSSDDNTDGKLDGVDYQSLFAFYLNDRKLHTYDFPNKTVLDFNLMNKTDYVYILLGVDSNSDLEFDKKNEPKTITSLDIKSRTITPLVSNEMMNEIQGIMDEK